MVLQEANVRTQAFWAVAGVTLVLACGKGKDQAQAVDSTRDLALAPQDSSVPLNDQPPAQPPAETPTAPKPAAPKPSSPTPKPAAPAPAPVARTLAAGTTITGTTATEIHSGTNKDGDLIEVPVSTDVTDSRGRVVIPAGSVVTLKINRIRHSENKSDPDGTLAIVATSVSIDGKSYSLDGAVAKLPREMRNRGGALGDASKVAAGAGIGAIAGRVIGGGKTGTIIGGIVGGAVGAQRAVETKDRDVVVAAGTPVTITLNTDFSKS